MEYAFRFLAERIFCNVMIIKGLKNGHFHLFLHHVIRDSHASELLDESIPFEFYYFMTSKQA